MTDVERSLVIELQRLASDGSGDTKTLLRKVLIVATKLGIDEFKEWADLELRGYPSQDDLPEYRQLYGEISALNPLQGVVPFVIRQHDIKNQIGNFGFPDSVSSIESILEDSSRTHIQCRLEPWKEEFLRDSASVPDQFILTLQVGRNQLSSVLESVRDKVLNWALELERQGILGDGMSFSEQEKKAAEESSSIHIVNYGTVSGPVTAGRDNKINISGYNSIRKDLVKSGVTPEGRAEIEEVMDAMAIAGHEERESIVRRGFEWLRYWGPSIGSLSSEIRQWLEMHQ